MIGCETTEPKGERMNLPRWDGDLSGWRDCHQEGRWYKSGEDHEVNWSVAARLVGGLKGPPSRGIFLFPISPRTAAANPHFFLEQEREC